MQKLSWKLHMIGRTAFVVIYAVEVGITNSIRRDTIRITKRTTAS